MSVAATHVSVAGATIGGMAAIRRDSRFVGRERELRTLKDLVASAVAGQARAVLVAGDAGVGKTRLVAELVAQAHTDGALVMTGHCVEMGAGGLPYLPFAEALTRVVAGEGPPAAAERIRDLARDRPVLARIAAAAPAAHGDEVMERLPLFDAVWACLVELARDVAPVVLVLEDLHWADASSLDLLRFLLIRLGVQRLLVVATYRADDLHRRHPLRPVVAELARLRGVERLDLPPLSERDLARLLRALHGRPLPVEVVHDIAVRSEGNPYFAEELLAAGAAEGTKALPAALSDVLLTRLEGLGAGVQEVARVAAVAGRRVSDAMLRAACPLPAAEVDAALRHAVAHLVLVPGSADSYAFRHALMQEAVYADLLPGERVRLHATYVRLLRGAGAGASAAELAHHCMASHDLAGALEASIRAADEAVDRLAPAEALAHAELALQLWDAVPSHDRPVGVEAVDLTLKASMAASAAGELARAAALAGEATELALADGDPDRLATARWRLAHHLYAVHRLDEALDQAQEATRLLADLPASPARVWAAAVQVRVLCAQHDWDAALDLLEPALAEARTLGVAPAEADLLTSFAVSEGHRGNPEAALAHLKEALQSAEAAHDPATTLRAAYNLGVARHDLGDLHGARDILLATIDGAQRAGLGSSLYGSDAWWILVATLTEMGGWEEAWEVVERGRAALPASIAATLPVAATRVLSARDPEAALQELDAFEAVMAGAGWERPLLIGVGAEAMAWLGRYEDAATSVESALDEIEAGPEPLHLVGIRIAAVGLSALADMAESARLRGDSGALDAAKRRGARLLADAQHRAARGRPAVMDMGPEGLGWLARASAESARLEGRNDIDAWRAVVEIFAGGYRYDEALARWRLAEALAEAGQPEAATTPARAARRIAVELRAHPLRDALDALARRARLDLGSGVPAAGGVLTPREAEVMRLVAGGLTNRKIGQHLFISEKTASVHVSNVLGKLGASGRAEAVAIAHRRGLLGPLDDSGTSATAGA